MSIIHIYHLSLSIYCPYITLLLIFQLYLECPFVKRIIYVLIREDSSICTGFHFCPCTTLEKTITIAREHVYRLWSIKQQLCESTSSLGVMKLHALDHIPAHIYMYGVPKYHDTASFEHAHIDDAVIQPQKERKLLQLNF